MINLAEPITIWSDQLHLEMSLYGAWISHLSLPGQSNLLATRDWASPVDPGDTNGYGSSSIDFHAEYRGGWHLLFPNAGYETDVLGVRLPFHGEVARQFWVLQDHTESRVTMFTHSRLPLTITRTVSVEGARVRIEDSVRNDCPETIPFLLGHHPVFPLTSQVALDLPDSELAEISYVGLHSRQERSMSDPTHLMSLFTQTLDSPFQGLFTVSKLSGGWYALRGLSGGAGVAVAWDMNSLPNLWLWIENQSGEFPWFGRAQYLGVEPQRASTPDGLAKSIEIREHLSVKPGETQTIWLEMTVFSGGDSPVKSVIEGEGPKW